MAERALPAGDVGPVDFWALARLAAILASEVGWSVFFVDMGIPFGCRAVSDQLSAISFGLAVGPHGGDGPAAPLRRISRRGFGKGRPQQNKGPAAVSDQRSAGRDEGMTNE